jgi:hypothetical protein
MTSARPRAAASTRWLALAMLALPAWIGCGDRVRYVSESGSGAFEASLAARGDGFAVAWYDQRDGNPELYMRLLARDGRPAGPERRLTRDPEASYEPDVVPVGEAAFAVAWYDKDGNGALRPRLGLWTQDGQRRWTAVVAPRGRNTIVRVRDRELFVAWIEDETDTASTVWGQWWSIDGSPIDVPIRLAPAARTTWNLNADLDRYGRAWVVFDARVATRADEVFLVRAGSPPLRLSADDGVPSTYPDIAVSRARVAITWVDEKDGNKEVYLSVAVPEEIADRFAARSKRLTYTAGASAGAYLAWNGRVLGVAWYEETDGQHEIYFQSLDANGRDLLPAARQTETPRASLVPSIVPWRDTFALAWNEYAPGAEDGSTAQSQIAFNVVE